MTDRELLEMAAKAANIPNAGYTGGRGLHVNPDNDYESGWWNPLIDDGDALRLAVKLELQMDLRHSCNTVRVYGSADGRIDEGAKDPCAATRRAIVRAAAEIGTKVT